MLTLPIIALESEQLLVRDMLDTSTSILEWCWRMLGMAACGGEELNERSLFGIASEIALCGVSCSK